MQALQWALDAPDELGAALVICASSRLSAQNIAFSAVARTAIMSDPDFRGGDYYEAGVRPDRGLAVARQMAHITYLSAESMRRKFGRRLQNGDVPRLGFDIDFQVESYLQHQGESFLRRFDANSYLYLSRVMDYFEPFADPVRTAAEVGAMTSDVLVVSFDTDWRFDAAHSREIVRVLSGVRRAGHLPRGGVAARARLVPAGGAGVPPDGRRLPRPGGAGADAGPRRGVRADLDLVAQMIAPGSRVLDLGCGDGDLLAELIASRGCRGQGVEVSREALHACVERGVPVVEADIDRGLPEFEDGAFDVVVLSQTLQAVRRPALALREVTRVGRLGIVSFPNFGHWRLRAQLLLRGRMPVTRTLPYRWHETPNVHLCTIRDFESLAGAEGLTLLDRRLLDAGGGPAPARAARRPNLLAAGAAYLLRR